MYYRREDGELGKFGADSDDDRHSSSQSFVDSFDEEEPEESEAQWIARMAVEADPFQECPENEPWGP